MKLQGFYGRDKTNIQSGNSRALVKLTLFPSVFSSYNVYMITHDMIRRCPKVELHDHLDGGLRPKTIIELAEKYDISLPEKNPEDLRQWFSRGCRQKSLSLYLETFGITTAVMQTKEALTRVAKEAMEDLAAENVVYAEIRFAPALHMQRGLNLEEVAHTPCFIYDPVSKATGRRDALIQTIDYAPTVLDFCGLPIPKDMNGKSLLGAVRNNEPVHDTIIYGAFGAQITCTDGRYKYILSPKKDNWPLYNYTLMPTHMRARFHVDELQDIELSEPFSFTKGVKLMKIPDRSYIGGSMPLSVKRENPGVDRVFPHAGTPEGWKSELFDLENDPHEMHPIDDPEIIARLRRAMVERMMENDAPVEQYTRMGLEKEYAEATR